MALEEALSFVRRSRVVRIDARWVAGNTAIRAAGHGPLGSTFEPCRQPLRPEPCLSCAADSLVGLAPYWTKEVYATAQGEAAVAGVVIIQVFKFCAGSSLSRPCR